MILALGSDCAMRLVEVPSEIFAAHHMTLNPGTRARLFDLRFGQSHKLADVRICADDFHYNLKRIKA